MCSTEVGLERILDYAGVEFEVKLERFEFR